MYHSSKSAFIFESRVIQGDPRLELPIFPEKGGWHEGGLEGGMGGRERSVIATMFVYYFTQKEQ